MTSNDATEQAPSNLDSRRASPAYPAPLPCLQVQRPAYLEATHEGRKSSGLEGREVTIDMLGSVRACG